MNWLKLHADWGTVVLVSAAVVGIALRVVGLDWGLPAELHSDEWVITTGALDLAQRHSFEPSLYFRPDHVEIQLSYIAYQAYSHLILHSTVEAAYAANPGVFLLLSRIITALFGIVMIALAYLIGKRFNRGIAIIAVVLFALFPPFIRHSHYATPDIPLAAAVMVVILALMYYQERPGYLSLLVASGATSVAIAIKYPGALAATMIAIVVIVTAVRDRSFLRILTHGATAIAAVVFILFLISPVLFTNFRAVLNSIRQESGSTYEGLGWSGNVAFYAEQYLISGGILLSLAMILGIFTVIRLRLVAILPVLLGGIFWIALSAVAYHWERWGTPMSVAFLMLSSVGLYYSYRYLSAHISLKRWRTPVTIVVSALVVTNLLLTSIEWVARFLATDTRVGSQLLFAERGITDKNAIFEGYSPLLTGSPKPIFDDFTHVDGRLVAIDQSRRFVVTSSCMNDRYFNDDKFVVEQDFYAELDSQFKLELRVTPAVGPLDPSPVEPINIVRAAQSILTLAGNPTTECTIKVYRIGE
jgi:hypothetical protein